MSNEQRKDNKFFLWTLKKKVSNKGTPFWTGKMAYAVEFIAFEKKDGSGDITIWGVPKDMDEIAQRGQGQPKNFAPRSNHPYAPKQAPAPPMPSGDDEEFGF